MIQYHIISYGSDVWQDGAALTDSEIISNKTKQLTVISKGIMTTQT